MRPDDLVNLYVKLIQNCAEMATLGNAVADPKLQLQLDADSAAFTAYRCFYLAESYFGLSKFAEAYALFDRCIQYVL